MRAVPQCSPQFEAGKRRFRRGPGAASASRAEALAALKPKTLTLDGEATVFDAELVSRFEWLRHINHGELATPPLYVVFDLLQLGERTIGPSR